MEPELKQIAEIIRRGGLAACPTDTTWGILAAADSPEAIARVYHFKGRPAGKPLQLLAASPDLAERLIAPEARNARWRALSRRFWPGGLTLVAPASAEAPELLVAGGKLGVRVPAQARLRRLLEALGGWAAATSLNRSGAPPVTSYEEALAIGGELDYVAPGRSGATASTVYELPEGRILRVGAVSADEIAAALEETWTNA